MSKEEWRKLRKEKGMKFNIPHSRKKDGRKEWTLESVFKDAGTFKRPGKDAWEYGFFPCEMVEL